MKLTKFKCAVARRLVCGTHSHRKHMHFAAANSN